MVCFLLQQINVEIQNSHRNVNYWVVQRKHSASHMHIAQQNQYAKSNESNAVSRFLFFSEIKAFDCVTMRRPVNFNWKFIQDQEVRMQLWFVTEWLKLIWIY